MFFYFCADIDGLGVMRLISGIIAVEEKDRAARVGKVMKYVSIYNHFSPPWQNSIYVHIELPVKLSIVSSVPLTFWLHVAYGNDIVNAQFISVSIQIFNVHIFPF